MEANTMSASDEPWFKVRGMSLKIRIIVTSIPYIGGLFMGFLLMIKMMLFQMKSKKYMIPFRCFLGYSFSLPAILVIYNLTIRNYFIAEFNGIIGFYIMGFLSLLWQHKYLDKKTALYYKDQRTKQE